MVLSQGEIAAKEKRERKAAKRDTIVAPSSEATSEATSSNTTSGGYGISDF